MELALNALNVLNALNALNVLNALNALNALPVLPLLLLLSARPTHANLAGTAQRARTNFSVTVPWDLKALHVNVSLS